MFEDLTWYLPILKRTKDPKYIKKFKNAVSGFVRHHEELFDEGKSLPDPTADVSGLDGRTVAALVAAAVDDEHAGDGSDADPFADGRIIKWLNRLNEIDIQNSRRDMIMLTVKSSSGYCFPEYSYTDEITVTPGLIAYVYKPGIESESNPPRKWVYRLTEEHWGIYEDLITSVIEIFHRGASSGMFDVGTRVFTVTYSDSTEEEREFFLGASAFEDCFALIKKLIPPSEEIPNGIRTRDDDEKAEKI